MTDVSALLCWKIKMKQFCTWLDEYIAKWTFDCDCRTGKSVHLSCEYCQICPQIFTNIGLCLVSVPWMHTCYIGCHNRYWLYEEPCSHWAVERKLYCNCSLLLSVDASFEHNLNVFAYSVPPLLLSPHITLLLPSCIPLCLSPSFCLLLTSNPLSQSVFPALFFLSTLIPNLHNSIRHPRSTPCLGFLLLSFWQEARSHPHHLYLFSCHHLWTLLPLPSFYLYPHIKQK